jgi:hypothetical protein
MGRSDYGHFHCVPANSVRAEVDVVKRIADWDFAERCD